MTYVDDVSRFVLAIEGNDLLVFRTADEALDWIEAEDALSGELTFASGDGSALRPIADRASRAGWRLERSDGPLRSVRADLIRHLEAVSSADAEDLTRPIGELLAFVADMEQRT